MKLIYSDAHRDHAGAKEMRYDQMIPMCESPERMDMIMEALAAAGFKDVVQPAPHSLEVAHQIHSPAFVSFLEKAYPMWEREFGPGGFATAYTFGMRGMNQVPNGSIHSMLSCYTFDVCVPFVKGTWTAIRSAMDVALTGASLMAKGEAAVFSLCRPPGHHASGDLAGGYCYMNNAAIAAQAHLNNGAGRVAILDIDYHHGNGTQTIFYGRKDVFFASLHCRPEEEYPFLLGYATERGEGEGQGYNLNLPMPRGTDYGVWSASLLTAIDAIRALAPSVLIVSLGVDTYEGDPVGGFRLASQDYLDIGRQIAGLELPTQFVMEGGYAMEALGTNVANVIRGFTRDGEI
ncbi:acetoin utilization deacetylase AcuC-like enzyme [Hoeflea marina]|uniref:Acetoin utilization deacetylase AcuC-like enzyme n=1 Tax=Hoeflea marina TaxID=274592 RepID=A0A317PS49_9HYPH|nr:histone deacetylase family protein [Hoeflea marina]PWW03777.1 acetoin utilization deacetylase AcuC-like enzyme [Hoeflea marina]